jgi:hypothetical protein
LAFSPNRGQRRALGVQKPGPAGNASRAYLLNLWAPKPKPKPAAPARPTGPAVTPGIPAAPGTPSAPWDTQFENTRALLGNQRDQSLTNIDLQEAQAKTRYGLEDVSDPFSRAAMLTRSYQQSRTGASNSLAARGQLYAGAYQNEMGTQDYNYNQSRDALGKEYSDLIQSLIQKRQAARGAYDTGVLGAGADRLDRALAQPLEPVAGKPKVGLQGKTKGGGPAIVAPGAITPADRRAAKRKKKK